MSDFTPFGIVPFTSWATRCVAYPLGVKAAWVCHRLRMSPNSVSVLSWVVGVASTLAAAFYVDSEFWGGVLLLLGLQLAYVLDCADGVLARATGRCSDFGAIFDKTLDCISMVLIPGLLCVAGPAHLEMNPMWVGPLILVAATPSVALAMIIWLKGYVQTGGSKTVEDTRKHTAFWLVARMVAFLLDTPVFRLVLAVSWMTHTFVEFMIGYGIFCTLALILYLFKSSRELA